MFRSIKIRTDHSPCPAAVGGLLVLASLIAMFLVGFRGYYSGRETYFFLFKDLFLAWVPMGLSVAIVWSARQCTRRAGAVCLLVGLVLA